MMNETEKYAEKLERLKEIHAETSKLAKEIRDLFPITDDEKDQEIEDLKVDVHAAEQDSLFSEEVARSALRMLEASAKNIAAREEFNLEREKTNLATKNELFIMLKQVLSQLEPLVPFIVATRFGKPAKKEVEGEPCREG